MEILFHRRGRHPIRHVHTRPHVAVPHHRVVLGVTLRHHRSVAAGEPHRELLALDLIGHPVADRPEPHRPPSTLVPKPALTIRIDDHPIVDLRPLAVTIAVPLRDHRHISHETAVLQQERLSRLGPLTHHLTNTLQLPGIGRPARPGRIDTVGLVVAVSGRRELPGEITGLGRQRPRIAFHTPLNRHPLRLLVGLLSSSPRDRGRQQEPRTHQPGDHRQHHPQTTTKRKHVGLSDHLSPHLRRRSQKVADRKFASMEILRRLISRSITDFVPVAERRSDRSDQKVSLLIGSRHTCAEESCETGATASPTPASTWRRTAPHRRRPGRAPSEPRRSGARRPSLAPAWRPRRSGACPTRRSGWLRAHRRSS